MVHRDDKDDMVLLVETERLKELCRKHYQKPDVGRRPAGEPLNTDTGVRDLELGVPSSPEAEQALLGCILLDNSVLDSAHPPTETSRFLSAEERYHI